MLQLRSAKAPTLFMSFIVFHIHLCCALGFAIWGKPSRAKFQVGGKNKSSNKTTFPWGNTGSNRAFCSGGSPAVKHWGTGFVFRFIGCQCLLEPTCTHECLQRLFLTQLEQSTRRQSTPCPTCAAAGCPQSGAGASSNTEEVRQKQRHAPSAKSYLLLPVTHCLPESFLLCWYLLL